MTDLTPRELDIYRCGINLGLETAAENLEHVADLATGVWETDCTYEATMYRVRARDIRALKAKVGVTPEAIGVES
ncbi:MAG TPA: hypothetical protein VGU67_02710 [Edaphobacter sp.]|nr:hypothetical protein [Edaphobacter sp.]